MQARILELYGKLGEYDSTTNAVNTEDGDEDMQVFKAKLTLKEASTHCSIRVNIANFYKLIHTLTASSVCRNPKRQKRNVATGMWSCTKKN
jgi:hypothetical protein